MPLNAQAVSFQPSRPLPVPHARHSHTSALLARDKRHSSPFRLPADVLYIILLQPVLTMVDLAQFSLSCRAWKTWLGEDASQAIWKRKAEGLPRAAPGISALAYAKLAFTETCSQCHRDTNLPVDWRLRVRLCKSCRGSQIKPIYELPVWAKAMQPYALHSQLSGKKKNSAKTYYLPDLIQLSRELGMVQVGPNAATQLAQWTAERKRIVERAHSFSTACNRWTEQRRQLQRENRDHMLSSYKAELLERLERAGLNPQDCDDYILMLPSGAIKDFQGGVISAHVADADWQRNGPDHIAAVQHVTDIRMATEAEERHNDREDRVDEALDEIDLQDVPTLERCLDRPLVYMSEIASTEPVQSFLLIEDSTSLPDDAQVLAWTRLAVDTYLDSYRETLRFAATDPDWVRTGVLAQMNSYQHRFYGCSQCGARGLSALTVRWHECFYVSCANDCHHDWLGRYVLLDHEISVMAERLARHWRSEKDQISARDVKEVALLADLRRYLLAGRVFQLRYRGELLTLTWSDLCHFCADLESITTGRGAIYTLPTVTILDGPLPFGDFIAGRVEQWPTWISCIPPDSRRIFTTYTEAEFLVTEDENIELPWDLGPPPFLVDYCIRLNVSALFTHFDLWSNPPPRPIDGAPSKKRSFRCKLGYPLSACWDVHFTAGEVKDHVRYIHRRDPLPEHYEACMTRQAGPTHGAPVKTRQSGRA